MTGRNFDSPLPQTQQRDAPVIPFATFSFQHREKKKEGTIRSTLKGDLSVCIDGVSFRLPLQMVADWGIKQWKILQTSLRKVSEKKITMSSAETPGNAELDEQYRNEHGRQDK